MNGELAARLAHREIVRGVANRPAHYRRIIDIPTFPPSTRSLLRQGFNKLADESLTNFRYN